MYYKSLLALSLLLIGFVSFAQQEGDSLVFTTYRYEGGAISSEGYLRQGKPDGYWKSYYRNGNLKAEGNRKNYLLDGEWKFFNEDGELHFSIAYAEDKKNGLRKTYEEGNLVKEEPFVDDVQQGFTRYYYPAGELLKEVPYQIGAMHGKGYEYAKDGRIITLLTFKSGVLTRQQRINRRDDVGQKQGMWLDFHPNRNIKVEGPYVNDLKNGYWKYYQPNGNLIRVEKWVMGVLQQNADEIAKIEIRREIYENTGTLKSKGSYRNGKREGVHREYDEEGNVIAGAIYENGIKLYEGIVDEEGRKQGPWKAFFATGELRWEGSFKDNLKVGGWKYLYQDGKLEQRGSYIRGMEDGLWEWRYENGQTWREEEYVMGREDGPSVEYNDTGAVIAQGEYIDGFREGKWIFMVNDHKEEGSFFEGERTGQWVYYYLQPAEQLQFEGTYEAGLESGMHVYYWANGKVKRRGNYVAGIKEGVWEHFNIEGVSIITIEYEDGREVKYNGEKISFGKRLDREEQMEREQEDEQEL